MTHEYTEYTCKQEIADLSLRLILFVKKCKIIKKTKIGWRMKKPEEGFSKEKSPWYNFSEMYHVQKVIQILERLKVFTDVHRSRRDAGQFQTSVRFLSRMFNAS